ncbi:MAG TPA: hypothetical protein PLX97_15115 [Gemmatales bacterium]|nr:hypothetical protein [Gemmatales bacterium]
MDAEAFGLRRFAYAGTKYYGVLYWDGFRTIREEELLRIETYQPAERK